MGALFGIRLPGSGGGVARSAAGVCERLPADVNVWAILAVAASVLLIVSAIGWARDTLALAAERARAARLEAGNKELRRQVIALRAAGRQP